MCFLKEREVRPGEPVALHKVLDRIRGGQLLPAEFVRGNRKDVKGRVLLAPLRKSSVVLIGESSLAGDVRGHDDLAPEGRQVEGCAVNVLPSSDRRVSRRVHVWM